MDLLLSVDVFKIFFESRSSFPKKDNERAIVSLFENENNLFLISKKLLGEIEKLAHGNPAFESFITPFLTHIIENRSLNIAASNDAKGNFEIIKSMDFNYKLLNVKKSDLYFDIALNERSSLNGNKSIIIEKIDKPNFHWLTFNLACYNPQPVVLRYADFQSNNQIEQTFSFLLECVQKPSFVDIYDKQVNLNHNLFDGIKSKLRINYYTGFGRGIDENIEKTQIIKKYFSNVKVLKAKSKYIHERKIVIKSLVIECDDDFWNLSVDRPNWKIDITYCQSVTSKLAEKQQYFSICKFN